MVLDIEIKARDKKWERYQPLPWIKQNFYRLICDLGKMENKSSELEQGPEIFGADGSYRDE